MLCNDVRHQHRFEYAHRRRRGSRNLLHSGNFRERAIGNLDNFSDFTVLIQAELLSPPKISSPPTLMKMPVDFQAKLRM